MKKQQQKKNLKTTIVGKNTYRIFLEKTNHTSETAENNLEKK